MRIALQTQQNMKNLHIAARGSPTAKTIKKHACSIEKTKTRLARPQPTPTAFLCNFTRGFEVLDEIEWSKYVRDGFGIDFSTLDDA